MQNDYRKTSKVQKMLKTKQNMEALSENEAPFKDFQ